MNDLGEDTRIKLIMIVYLTLINSWNEISMFEEHEIDVNFMENY